MVEDIFLYCKLPLIDLVILKNALRVARERSMLPDVTREYQRLEELCDRAAKMKHKIPRTI